MFGLQGRLAVRGVEAGLSRTGIAVAALVVAVAATVGVAIMIHSFRGSVTAWLASTLQADVYITAPGPGSDDAGPVLAPELVRRLAQVEGVGAISTGRWVTVRTEAGNAQLQVLQPAPQSRRAFTFKAGEPADAWSAFDRGRAVFMSEPFAYRHRLRVGDALRLQTDRGTRVFAIAGVYTDYGSSQGVVTMPRDVYDRHWDDPGISSLGIYVAAGASERRVLERLRAAARGQQDVLIRSNRALRDQSLAIFDRTFAVTRVLRLLAVLVAVAGILSALLALQLERAKEFALLRATGFTPGQVGWLVTGEAGLLGLISGVLAVPLGIVMALVLIEAINRRAFGWSIQLTIAPEAVLQALLVATAAALLAGLYPAWKQSYAPPAEALRSE